MECISWPERFDTTESPTGRRPCWISTIERTKKPKAGTIAQPYNCRESLVVTDLFVDFFGYAHEIVIQRFSKQRDISSVYVVKLFI